MDGCLVISAGEGRENVLEAGSYCLTEAERTLPEQVTSRFERTVVVVGSGNVTDLSRAGELGVSPLLLAWPGGMEGGRAVAEQLSEALDPDPAHPFKRMTVTRGQDGAARAGWEPAPTASTDRVSASWRACRRRSHRRARHPVPGSGRLPQAPGVRQPGDRAHLRRLPRLGAGPYPRGFRICVAQAGPRTIMTSYNRINGQWARCNGDLVTTILCGE